MKTAKVNRLFLLIIIAGLFCACDSSVVYEENIAIKGSSWNRNDILKFYPRITDSISSHNLYINIRNAGNYEFQNLYIFLTISSPSGNHVKDTVECVLADEKGKWYGAGIGDLFSLRIPYKMNIYFPDTGVYTIALEQAMRTEILENIADVGVRVETSDKK